MSVNKKECEDILNVWYVCTQERMSFNVHRTPMYDLIRVEIHRINEMISIVLGIAHFINVW